MSEHTSAASPMTFDAFLQAAWNDHADRPEEVADRLASSLSVVETPQQVPAFAHLVVHVFGEHLREWQRGVEVLESMRGLPLPAGSAAVAASLNRAVAVLRYTGDDSAALESLSTEDRISVLATAASAFTAHDDFKRALATYAEAVRLAGRGLPEKSPAIRSLAIGGNNLAAALEQKKDRDARETEGMVVAAECGLTYWKQAGTWLEAERAEYRVARSRIQAGDAPGAIVNAKRCIEGCEQNGAPPFERFFGHAVLALAQRAANDTAGFNASRGEALRLFEQVPPDERHWCEAELKELRP